MLFVPLLGGPLASSVRVPGPLIAVPAGTLMGVPLLCLGSIIRGGPWAIGTSVSTIVKISRTLFATTRVRAQFLSHSFSSVNVANLLWQVISKKELRYRNKL